MPSSSPTFPTSPIDSQGLEAYFTNVEHLRKAFRATIVAWELAKRLLIIHGVGGVGKSSLLRMLRLHCKSANVRVGLALGESAEFSTHRVKYKEGFGLPQQDRDTEERKEKELFSAVLFGSMAMNAPCALAYSIP